MEKTHSSFLVWFYVCIVCFQLHEGLGLGITGPPIPPPATFSVVPYPVKRKPHMGVEPGLHFAFIAASLDDP